MPLSLIVVIAVFTANTDASLQHKYIFGGQTAPSIGSDLCSFASAQTFTSAPAPGTNSSATVNYAASLCIGGGPAVVHRGDFDETKVYSVGCYLFPDKRLFVMDTDGSMLRQMTPMAVPRSLHTMTMIGTDTFAVCGGSLYGGPSIASCQAYNIATTEWTDMPDMPLAVAGHTAAFQGTKLVVFGGSPWCRSEHKCSVPCTYVVHNKPTVQVYDTTTHKWTFADDHPGGDIRGALSMASSSAVPDSSLIAVCGGYSVGLSGPTNMCYYFDVTTLKWSTQTTAMEIARFAHQLVITRLTGDTTLTSQIFGGAATATFTKLSDVFDTVESLTIKTNGSAVFAQSAKSAQIENYAEQHYASTRFGLLQAKLAVPVAMHFAVQVLD